MGKRGQRRAGRPATLAAYLEASGESQAELAARVGTSQAHISRIAAGEAVPGAELALRLAVAAAIPLDSFVRVYLARKGAA